MLLPISFGLMLRLREELRRILKMWTCRALLVWPLMIYASVLLVLDLCRAYGGST